MLKETWLAFAIALAFVPAEAAVPTEAECKSVMAKMSELTEDDFVALKSKKKTNAEIAEAIMRYVEDEDRAAEQVVLLRMAFEQYVVAKDFQNANAVYQKARKMGGVEFAVMVATPMRSKMAACLSSRYPAVKGLCELLSSDEKSIKQIKTLKNQLGKDPSNVELSEKLGNKCAAIGDWETALSAYTTTQGELQKIAEWELDGGRGQAYTAAKTGTFWWRRAEDSALAKDVQDGMKRHSAMWYRVALNDGAFRGSDRKIVERRIAEADRCAEVKSSDGALFETRLQYIESTGGQWIDTGIVPDAQTKIELIDFQVMNWTCGWCEFCGSASGDGTDDCFEFRRVRNNDVVGVRIGNPNGGDYSNFSGGLSAKTKCRSITFDKSGLVSRQFKARMVNDNVNKKHKGKNTIFLFASNQNGNAFRPSAIRLGGAKIWQGKNLVRDMIPVLQKGEVCMFDNVSKKFFARQGGEKFLGGR